MKKITLVGLMLLLLVAGCSSKFSMVVAPRDVEFFENLVNPSSMSSQMPNKMNEAKLLATGEEYPMRFVLFDDGSLFYQVDRLGEGYGTWTYQDGGVKFFASRKLFDMNIYLTAKYSEGKEMLVRFLDRHGFQSVNIEHWDRTQIENQEKELKVFSKSLKDI